MRAWFGLVGFVLCTQYWLLPATGPLLAVMAAGIGALWVPWGWATQRLLSGRLMFADHVARSPLAACRLR